MHTTVPQDPARLPAALPAAILAVLGGVLVQMILVAGVAGALAAAAVVFGPGLMSLL